jgi:hypothetical protein
MGGELRQVSLQCARLERLEENQSGSGMLILYGSVLTYSQFADL